MFGNSDKTCRDSDKTWFNSKTPYSRTTSLHDFKLRADLRNDITGAIDAADSKRLAAIMEKHRTAVPYVCNLLSEHIEAFNTRFISSTISTKSAAEYSPQKVGVILDALPHSELVKLNFDSIFSGMSLYDNENREIATLIGVACLSPYVLFEENASAFLNTHGDFESFAAFFLEQLAARENASLPSMLAAMTFASVSCLNGLSMTDKEGKPGIAGNAICSIMRMDYVSMSKVETIRAETLRKLSILDGQGLDGSDEGAFQLLTESRDQWERQPGMTRRMLIELGFGPDA